MRKFKEKIIKGVFVCAVAGAVSFGTAKLNLCTGVPVKAEQNVESTEECREKFLNRLAKVYKHYNKIFYNKKAYVKLTALYEEGVSAVKKCKSIDDIKKTYTDYKNKLNAVKPTKLIKYQKETVNKLQEAYDNLVKENEFSKSGLKSMESLKEKGTENIYGSKNKRRVRNALNKAVEELTAFAGSPEATRDVISELEATRKKLIDNAKYYNSLDDTSKDTWCFKRMSDHSPSLSYEFFKISDYNGFFLNKNVSDDDKVIYLTFDCGYPSDLTKKILDTLAKHNAKASFFVTKMYLEKCGDYAKRMVKEGHAVCNHTVTHTDLRNKSVEKIASEIIDVAEYFYELTGTEFAPFFRTPTGAYTKRLLTIIKDAGYKTVFWSIAYGDYDEKNQPAPGYVTNHFKTYHHNGAIALMHNDSTSNANELDAVLTLLEKEGYRFGLLDEIAD